MRLSGNTVFGVSADKIKQQYEYVPQFHPVAPPRAVSRQMSSADALAETRGLLPHVCQPDLDQANRMLTKQTKHGRMAVPSNR